jgi:hypothetical protein
MDKLYIENEEDAKRIFYYCKTRLPILDGFDLAVERPVDCNNDEIGYDGVKLIVTFGDKTISKWHGTDEDDALLCIYKDLVYYFKDLAERKPIVKNALGKKHYSNI